MSRLRRALPTNQYLTRMRMKTLKRRVLSDALVEETPRQEDERVRSAEEEHIVRHPFRM
jgi:hypothetical protein